MSFFPHPKTVLSNGRKTVDYIIPLSEKEKVLEQLGVDTFYIVEFDKAFASLSPKDFISNYLVDLGVVHAVAGYDFTYGKFGAGKVDMIKTDSNGRIDITTVSKVEYKGNKISSTWIRQILLNGNIEELPQLMGRPYELVCQWDGRSFTPLSQYLVPAPGCYKVTIHSGNTARIANIEVPEDRESIQLLDSIETHVNSSKVSIVWHRRVQAGAIYSYSN
jgi:riboflavin kinase/FMN adenylyltransferase